MTKSSTKRKTEGQRSLYLRMGGDAFITMMVDSYFDELVEDRMISKFFKNIPMVALKVHQVKFFQVCFGQKSDQATAEELMDYLLITHTRLFREHGMDETHFDHVAKCLVGSLQTFLVDQELIDEAVALLGPLRSLFERGAQIARDEKSMTDEERASLPITTASTWQLEDMAQVLPEYKVNEPDWLPDILRQLQPLPHPAMGRNQQLPKKEEVIRAWTCKITNALAEDTVVADTFMDMPYLQHHAYIVTFLQLAFQPTKQEQVSDLLNTIRYPRGRNNPSLTKALFGRMVKHFSYVCETMNLDVAIKKGAISQLQSFSSEFKDSKPTKVGTTPHTIHPSRKEKKQDKYDQNNLVLSSLSSSGSSRSSSFDSSRLAKKSSRNSAKTITEGKKRSILNKLRSVVSGDHHK